jgi:hypothetical protein
MNLGLTEHVGLADPSVPRDLPDSSFLDLDYKKDLHAWLFDIGLERIFCMASAGTFPVKLSP